MANLAHNEKTKLTANMMNASAMGLIAAGALAPLVAATLDPAKQLDTWILVQAALYIVVAVLIHLLGRLTLDFLRE